MLTGTLPPGVGDPAPDATLLDLDGGEVALSSLWKVRPAVLVFLRYFGCPFCQAQVVSLRDNRERFREAGANVVLIGQGDIEDGLAFIGSREVPFPVLLDPDRVAYRAYGLVRGTIMQVLGPQVVLPFVRENLRAESRQRGLKGGDFMQMPGTFVVDTGGIVRAIDGVVRFAHRNKHVADTPRNQVILDVLAKLRVGPTGR